MSGWVLAIDFGTTTTSAAMGSSGRVEVVEIDGSARVSSVVLATESGELVVGAAAEAQLGLAPERAERTPKRRLGDEVMLLGSRPVRPVEAVAAVLSSVSAEAIRRQGGEPPSELRLTHPARWGSVRRAKLSEAAVLAGLPEPVFVPEPVAAAVYFADERVDEGAYVAVYDLGGGTFDTAVLRRSGDGFDVVGIPGGSERLGGESFDERLFLHVGERIAADDPDAWEQLRFSTDRSWRKAGYDLRSEVRRAKEALSANAEYTVYVGSPVDAAVLVTRDELEALIGADVRSTVDELEATVQRAGISMDQLAAVNLAGGSSRIPLVTRLVAERFGQVPQTWGDPKAAVALGAVKATRLTSIDSSASGAGSGAEARRASVTPLPYTVGGLRVLAELGRGGMGVVYLAKQDSIDRLVAVKSLPIQDPNLSDRLTREAAVLAELQHPHISTVIDVATDDRGTHVVMPYFPGGTAAHLVEGGRPLEPAAAVAIVAAVAEALAATHDKGFLHRDVKPSNVLLSEAGDVYLADFGLALPMLDSARLTNSRSVLGTAPYTAPEILSDQAPTPAADTYSLGIMAYQLLTGSLPYAGSNVMAVLDAVRTGSPTPITEAVPGVPAEIAQLVTAAFAADPADRPQDLRAWANELRATSEPTTITPAPPASWAAAAAAAAVAAPVAVAASAGASSAESAGGVPDASDLPTAGESDGSAGSGKPSGSAGADASDGDDRDRRPRRRGVLVGIAAAVVLLLAGTAFALTRDGEPDSIEVASAAAIESPEATTTTSAAAPVATSPVPDVRGKSKDEAVGLLTGAGFTPVVTELENAAPAGTPLGSVYAMDPLPFTEHPAGTTITIAVAAAPAPAPAPQPSGGGSGGGTPRTPTTTVPRSSSAAPKAEEPGAAAQPAPAAPAPAPTPVAAPVTPAVPIPPNAPAPTVSLSGPSDVWACYGAEFFEATVTNATSGVWRTSSGYDAVAQYLGLEIPYFLDWSSDYTWWVEYEATGPGGTTTERFYVTVHPDDRVGYIRPDSECAAVAV